jgi:uncharacterized protein YbaR (Trm112 family)
MICANKILHRRGRRAPKGSKSRCFCFFFGAIGDLGGGTDPLEIPSVAGSAALAGAVSYNAQVMIAKDLLEILVCPACKQALEYRQNPESLKCTQCHRVYAVKDDIPIMLIDEATIET